MINGEIKQKMAPTDHDIDELSKISEIELGDDLYGQDAHDQVVKVRNEKSLIMSSMWRFHDHSNLNPMENQTNLNG